ncbi:hypothetical protein DXG01_012961 [Tephrocybe rancida]|nr:hypothetical protein DXG01_012961 [Tephrocybe rancida]
MSLIVTANVRARRFDADKAITRPSDGNAIVSLDEAKSIVDNLTTGSFDIYRFPSNTPDSSLPTAAAIRHFTRQLVFTEKDKVVVCGSDSGVVQVIDISKMEVGSTVHSRLPGFQGSIPAPSEPAAATRILTSTVTIVTSTVTAVTVFTQVSTPTTIMVLSAAVSSGEAWALGSEGDGCAASPPEATSITAVNQLHI